MRSAPLTPLTLVFRSLIIASSLSPVLAFGAMAQVVPTRPPATAEPGITSERIKIEQMRPDVSKEPLIEDRTGGRGMELKEGVRFTLKGIDLEGATEFKSEELQALYSEYEGKEISLPTLNTIADKITAHYRNAGFILSRAVVPPQRIGDGRVTIRIVEGYINSIRVEGDVADGNNEWPIYRYIEKIKGSKPLNAADLERYLLLAEDLPGVSARAVLQPSPDVPGASDLVIKVEKKTIEGAVTADNRGSRFLGNYQGGLTVAFNDLLNMNERTQFRGIMTSQPSELQYGEVLHEQQIGGEGTKLAFNYSYTATEPGSKLEIFDIEGKSRSFSAGVTHPFLRSRQENIFAGLSYTYRTVDVSSLGVKLYEDNINAMRANGSYDFVDSWFGINRMELVISQGLGIDSDGSIPNRSRANGKTSFTKFNLDVSRLQPISGPWSVYAGAIAQWSRDPLLASEEMGIGGANFGYAYDPSEISGDMGVAGKIELQYNGDFESTLLSTYQYYVFYDAGKVWNHGTFAGEAGSAALSSAGVGVRFNAIEDLSADFQIATPLTRQVNANGLEGDATRAFFSLAYRF